MELNVEVSVDDLPDEVVEQLAEDLVERECTECEDTYLDTPDREEPLTCEDH